MYMQPIVAAKPLPSLARRRAVGAAVLLSGAIAMLPWLMLCAMLAAACFGFRALVALPHNLRIAVEQAGDYAYGI